MTKEEVKQEYRESEGDPQIRGARRRRARQMAFARMMDAVPTADVIVTNPTTLAVALKYDSLTMRAPEDRGQGPAADGRAHQDRSPASTRSRSSRTSRSPERSSRARRLRSAGPSLPGRRQAARPGPPGPLRGRPRPAGSAAGRGGTPDAGRAGSAAPRPWWSGAGQSVRTALLDPANQIAGIAVDGSAAARLYGRPEAAADTSDAS